MREELIKKEVLLNRLARFVNIDVIDIYSASAIYDRFLRKLEVKEKLSKSCECTKKI